MTYEQLLELTANIPFNQIERIEKEQLIYSDEVRKMCEMNGCGRYGKTWMCPPGVGPIDQWKERMLSFEHAVLFNYVGRIEDSFDFEGMMEIGEVFDGYVRQIKDLLTDNSAEFLIFGAGSCQLCKPCTYPDAPCKQPDQAIPSVESTGLFIAQMAEPCGFKYINGQNTVTNFGLVLFD